jgi:amino acid adenylation domain-containing protein
MLSHLEHLLATITAQSQTSLTAYEILNQADKIYLLETLNDTKADYPKDKTIVDLFEDQVKLTPEHIAIKFRDRELTYRELNEQSNQLAHYLINNYSIEPDDLVGIELERSEWMVIGILGIIKSGGAYVPIDPDYPEGRKKSIINQISSKIKIDQDFLDEFILVKSLNSSLNPNVNINSSSLVYCMFTSGSTGIPKGVLIEHKMLVNSTIARSIVYKDIQKKGLMLYSFSFDSSVNLTFRLLTSGGSLFIYGSQGLDLAELSGIIQKESIDTLTIPPSVYETLLSYEGLTSLKCVIVAGEECKPKVLAKHFETLFETKLYNEYGPTECVVWSTYKLFEFASDHVTIGQPVPSYRIVLLESNGSHMVPYGSIGEICIGGDSVGRGYLNDALLTSEKFIENPYRPGERLYRTGDLGRWNSEFELEYLGRIDNQVKIRGYRVELKEIEHAILQFGNIEAAIVVFSKNQSGDGSLVAYIKSEMAIDGLLGKLKQELPEYMLPDFIIRIEEVPLTTNLKVDYKKLPVPEDKKEREIIAPRNRQEEVICEIWREVLGFSQGEISITDHFFQLGGNSIKAIKLLAMIYKKLGGKIEISFLFEQGTIESIAKYLNDQNRRTIDSGYKEVEI